MITVNYKNCMRLKYKLSTLVLAGILLLLCFWQYNKHKAEVEASTAIILKPKINDIYFLDFRLLRDDLRPKEKYRLAKVVDITGDIITLVYGAFYYERQNAALNSIKFGHLSYQDYFEGRRYDLPLSAINRMYAEEAIYLAKRPVLNKLFERLVGPEPLKLKSNPLVYGKKENIRGEAFLNQQYSETNVKSAFDSFKQSADLGYATGQVNLAEMYLNGRYVDIDLSQTLHWLKQAALQSNKNAILKYGIVCKKVESCHLNDFYSELIDSGVNIKVRESDFKLKKIGIRSNNELNPT